SRTRSKASRASSPASMTICRRAPSTWSARSRKRSRRRARWRARRAEPMADKLQFELVSPEKLLLSEAVGMVVVPGGEGDFGVLPGQALFISTVRPGVISVYEDKT